MKRILKAKQKEFVKKCTLMLKELGAVDSPKPNSYSYNLMIDSRIGKLYLRVDEDNTCCYSVFGNFLENTQEAKAEFGHWKYNFHGGSYEDTVDEIVDAVKFHIQATF